MVPYGGLKSVKLQPGGTIVVGTATGSFGGAAVLVALAMDGFVLPMGRDKSLLEAMKAKVPTPERLELVLDSGDVSADRKALKIFGDIDAYLDFGPPQVYASTHIKSYISALRHGGRIVLMGGYREDVAIPHFKIM